MTENEFITFHHQCTFPPQRLATPTVTFSSHHELLFMSTITISESQLHTLCRSIKQWAVQYLCIMYLPIELNKSIQEIQFACLRELRCPSCGIQSLQGLNRGYLGQLEKLILSENNVCKVKAMRKMQSPLLQIVLDKNHVVDAEHLISLSSEVQNLVIQLFDKIEQCWDIRWVCKVSFPLNILYASALPRISNTQLTQTLRKKYHQLTLVF